MHTIRRLTGPLALIVLLAACSSGGAAPSTSPAPASPTPAPSIDPNVPASNDPGGGGQDPGNGGDLVVPKPGQIDPRPIPMDPAGLTAAVDGRHVVITASWTSGVEPCYVLDTVIVETGDKAFTITLREGHGPGDVVCIEIAQMKRTQIDLGELEPGTYAISDGAGGAAPIQVVVS
jgi:ABC-type transport system substrate-binding protein